MVEWQKPLQTMFAGVWLFSRIFDNSWRDFILNTAKCKNVITDK
jgi:hypothetical protein